jgi:glycosyltransferase involved in cell wall biosynthesis
MSTRPGHESHTEPPRKFLVVDAVMHGHHPLYLRNVSTALAAEGDVVVLAPGDLVDAAGPLPALHVQLGHDTTAGDQLRRAAQIAVRVGADHIVHLYGVRSQVAAWLRSRPLPVPGSMVVISPPVLHYPRIYGAALDRREVATAWAKEGLLQAWRRRADVHAVWTLEDAVSARWNTHRGAPAFWLPEAPAAAGAEVDVEFDCVVYGALGRRKGLNLLADAVVASASPLKILIAGRVLPADRDFVDTAVAAMRNAGSTVMLHDRWIEDHEVSTVLGAAACAVLSYPRHLGTSRVLLEAARIGTPVVAHAWGWLGATVGRRRLGLAVDCTDAAAFGAAIRLLGAPGARSRFASTLAGYADEHDWASYQAAVLAPFRFDPRRLSGPGYPQARVTAG